MPLNPGTTGVLDAAGAAAITGLFVQQTKFLVELVVKPENPNHDAIIRLYVNVVALAVVIVAELVSGILHIDNGQDWLNAVIQGFGVAIAATGGYHLLNGLEPQTGSGMLVAQPNGDTSLAPFADAGQQAPASLNAMPIPSETKRENGAMPLGPLAGQQSQGGSLQGTASRSAADGAKAPVDNTNGFPLWRPVPQQIRDPHSS